MALIDKETIRKEIERRTYNAHEMLNSRSDKQFYEGKDAAYGEILSILDTIPEQPVEMDNEEKIRNFFDAIGDCGFSQYDILRLKSIWEGAYGADKKCIPEQPVLPGIDEEGIPGRDFIPVEWVDACERYGKWKIVRAEQPVDWLEEHAKQYEAQHELSNDDSDAGAASAIRKMVKELADFYPDYK